MTIAPLDRASTVYVAGHRGLVGSAIWRALQADGFTDLVGRSSSELDLRDREAVESFFHEVRPRYVVVAAARVGGIFANASQPTEFLSDNLRIQTTVLDAAAQLGVERLLFLGSSCIYPRDCAQPIREEYLLTGPLEQTNEAYAIAKIAGLMHVKAVRRQFGLSWISAMPTNLFGPGDNYSAESSHVLPALIRRYAEAAEAGLPEVVNWGTGTPRREFLHADDCAAACLALLDGYDGESHVNIGSGRDIAIRDLADLVADVVGYEGRTVWDSTKPDGTPRKLLDVSRLDAMGWAPRVDLRHGIEQAVEEYRSGAAVRR
jgi:GDP-L-fucose synthase